MMAKQYSFADQVGCYLMGRRQGLDMVAFLTGIPIDDVERLVRQEQQRRQAEAAPAARLAAKVAAAVNRGMTKADAPLAHATVAAH